MTTTVNNEHKNIKVPNLRFKEFQGEWEKCTLSEVCKFHNGRAYKQSELLAAGKYRILRVGNFFTNDSWYYSNLELEDNKYAQDGDLLYAWSASFGPRFWKEEKVIYHYHIWKIDSFKNVDKEFMYHFLDLDSSKIKNEVQGGTMVHITKGNMEKRTISYPSINEQKKIAKLLSLLDERISTQNKIIDKLQSLIKGIADKLFQTARTTKPLLEFAPNITSGTDKSGSGTIPLYGSTGIIGTVKNASQKGNIVLVARVGTIGTVQYVNEPCGVSDNALIVEAGEMTKYIYHFLKTYNFTRITSGTTQPLITASSLKKAAIPTYDIESQTRIVLCLNGLEKKLDMAKQYLSDIAVMKQYLLRQMFI